jgi:hypothetical protein
MPMNTRYAIVYLLAAVPQQKEHGDGHDDAEYLGQRVKQ